MFHVKQFIIGILLGALLGSTVMFLSATLALRNISLSKTHTLIIDSVYKLDYPEEIKAISTDPNKPDTLLGYRKDSTVFTRYYHLK